MADRPISAFPSIAALALEDLYAVIDENEPNKSNQSKQATHLQIVDLLNASGLLSGTAFNGNPFPFRGALVYKSAAQSIPNDTSATLLWNMNDYDTDGIHDIITNTAEMIVPEGVTRVRLSASVEWQSNSTGEREAFIVKGGELFIGTGAAKEDADSASESILRISSAIVNVVAGEEFELQVKQTSGGALNVNHDSGHHTWYAMEVIE